MSLKPKQRQTLHTLIVIFLVAVAIRNIVYFTPYLLSEELIKRVDFPNYYMGAKLLRENKQNLYDLQVQADYYRDITGIDINKYHEYTENKYVGLITEFFLPFRALPPLAFLMLPLSYLSYSNAFWTFWLINFGTLLIASYLLTYKTHTTKQKIVTFVGLLAYEATFIALGQGQPTILLMLVTVVVYRLIKGERLFYAGLVSGLYLLKTHYIVITPFIWIITKLDRRYLVGLLISMIGFFIFSLVLVGPDVLVKYPEFIVYTENTEYFSPPTRLASIQSYLTNLAGLNTTTSPIIFVSMILYALTGGILYKQTKKYSLEYLFSMAVLFGILFSLHVFGQDLLIIYVSIALLATSSQKGYTNSNILTYACLLLLLTATYIKIHMLSTSLYIIVGIIFLTFPQLIQNDQSKS